MRAHPPERPQLHPLGLGRCTEVPELHEQLLRTIDQTAFTTALMNGTIGDAAKTILHTQQLDRQGERTSPLRSQSSRNQRARGQEDPQSKVHQPNRSQ